ncbi:MAG: hypothetical protein ABIO43_07360 [Sphingomicrobium sp.]
MITTILAALVASAQPAAPASAASPDQHQGMEAGMKGCACCKDMAKDKPMACCAKGEDARPHNLPRTAHISH